ncbi:hypothetical protein [Brachyspira aalborgi]|nr:hypothetical protein [Brachyspira aalborgi]
MKKSLLFFIVLLTISILIFSYKKINLLSPTFIPQETQFKVYTNILPPD